MNFSSDPINTIENLIKKNKTKSISIYLVVLLALAGVLSSLPIIKVDISNQSRGIIRSVTDNVPITAIVSGKITYINLKNNIEIKKGDTLLKISTEVLDTQKNVQDTLSQTTESLLNDVKNLLDGTVNQLKTYSKRETYYKFLAQKNELQAKVSQAQITYNRHRILYNKQVIARAEYEKYLFEYQFATQALQTYIKQQRAQWESEKIELQNQLKNVKGNLQKIEVEQTNYAVLAPTTGTIESFVGLQAGSFVTASQTIAIISPLDNLIVECSVSPNDIGLLTKKQKVKFQIDAFNYNQWGLLEGEIVDIDKNITLQESQAFFKVRCRLNSKKLKLKTGYTTEVSKGMTLTARFIITRRSLFDLLFDKIDDWINPKQLNT